MREVRPELLHFDSKRLLLLRYTLWLPVYLIVYWLLEHFITNNYWSTGLPVDRLIPFCEYFVIPYALWFPYLLAVGLFLLYREPDSFRRYMRFLAFGFLLSELVWFLVPNGQDLRPVAFAHNNFFTHAIAFLYRIDTPTNVFPSDHVVGAMGATWALLQSTVMKNRRPLRLAAVLFCALVCAATLLTKQHSVLDVVGGLGLSAAVGAAVYRKSLALRMAQSRQKLREFLQDA